MALPTDSLSPEPERWRGFLIRSGRFGAPVFIVLMALALVLFAATTWVLNGTVIQGELVVFVLLADVAYVLVLFSLIAWRLVALVGERRAEAGAALHLRLTGVFALVAMAPTIIVAIFATVSMSVGLEAWFSDTVRSVVNNSVQTAQAYAREHRKSIEGDALAMANDLNRAGAVGVPQVALTELLRRQQVGRRFPEAYLIDSARRITHRGDFSYTFTYDPPTEAQMAAARLGDLVVLEDQANNELRALIYLNAFIDTFLYVSREIDGEVLLLIDQAESSVSWYNQAENQRASMLTRFALIYLGFAVLVITVAIWLGLWFAERLSRPIGALAGAAQRVGEGDMDARVPESAARDEVALLGRVFNRMTAQVKGQRDALIAANRESESRRNFTETVLSGVSAGVVGLDADGKVELANDAARRMLGLTHDPAGQALSGIAPDAMDVFEKAARSISGSSLSQVEMTIGGEVRELLIRVAARSSSNVAEGYVMTIDDLTALVSAQREAAWGDVARRIAHEIKNPLTPIQLSAERLKRKFGKLAGDERANFDQYADVIVRQAADIRRMVDEFSRFARMPEPEAAEADVAEIARDAVLLQKSAREDIRYSLTGADEATLAQCDAGLISQALTNLIKNAGEAIDSKVENTPEFAGAGEVRVEVKTGDGALSLIVRDNGVGLPGADRARLTEPYVTTRKKGTGLGLAIVKKIAEQHRGELTLTEAEPFEPGAEPGAEATITIPLSGATEKKTGA